MGGATYNVSGVSFSPQAFSIDYAQQRVFPLCRCDTDHGCSPPCAAVVLYYNVDWPRREWPRPFINMAAGVLLFGVSMNANDSMMRRALYMLKREYGYSIVIHKVTGSETDVRTGEKVVYSTATTVDRAVVLPETLDRTTKQSISLISSNKQFVSGGTSDIGTRQFIVDRRDVELPTLTADDWLVYLDSKYQIHQVETIESAGWIITAKRISGEAA
jgi:hypothetical protein